MMIFIKFMFWLLVIETIARLIIINNFKEPRKITFKEEIVNTIINGLLAVWALTIIWN